MGRKERFKKEKREEIQTQAKIEIEKRRTEKYSGWNTFWRKWQFWVVIAAFLALIIYPFRSDIMNTSKDVEETNITNSANSAIIHTSMGDIAVDFYREDSPNTVENFEKLASDGFYDGLIFHRVIETFMIQTGDPDGDGTGGPGYEFEDEFNDHTMVAGSLAMANSGPNTNGSQFFIITEEEQPHLDGKHTVFGEVTSGLNVAVEISRVAVDENDKPIDKVLIQSIELLQE